MAKILEANVNDVDLECEECGNMPASDYAGQLLCKKCVQKDVFYTWEDRD